MKKKQIMYISILIILSTITEIQSIRHLSTEDLITIDDKLNDDIIKEDYTFYEEGDAYFSYDLLKFSSENYLVFNIHNSLSSEVKKIINIQCILSDSTTFTDVVQDFQTKDNICSSLHYFLNQRVIVLTPLSGYKEGFKLYLKIHSEPGNKISIFIREKSNYKTKLDEIQAITDSFAYVAYEFNPEEYYEKKKEYLLTSSETNGLLICKKDNTKLTLIAETKLLAISEQSLAAHFWGSEKIIIFVGKRDYDESVTDNDLTVSLKEQTDKNTKLYYYIPNNYGGLTSFHYECKDNLMEHYLIVNYDNLDSDQYYYKVHNLVGSKLNVLGYLSVDNKDIKQMEYSDIKRFNFLPKTDYHLQVFKLQCSEEGEKIIANIYYGKKTKNVEAGSLRITQFQDYFHNFENRFELNYGNKTDELGIEIFTPGVEEEKKFKVFFEGRDYVINNKNIYIFTIKNSESLSISSDDKTLETLISVSGIEIKKDADYLKMYNYWNGFDYYQYYKIDHEFNTNYYFDLEVNNPTNKVISLCYYVPNMEVFYASQNCFLFPSKTTRNITLGAIFKISEENDFNAEEPKYHFVLYNKDFTLYSINKVYFRSDLKKSTPIEKQLIDSYTELKYLDASLVKNEPSYFNLDIRNTTEVNHLDLYLLGDRSNRPNDLKLDIKCIVKYEFAIHYIEPYFTEDNKCIVINKDEINPNVYHILFNNTKKDANDIFIMKIIPTGDVDVKFIVKINDFISSYIFNFEQKIYYINHPSIYSIYEVNRTALENLSSKKNMILYDTDEDGIEFYARKDKEFLQIFKGSFNILKINEVLEQYKSYDTFIFVIGKYDCENKYCETTESKYQLKYFANLEDINIPIDKFNGNYRIPIARNDCKVDKPYYVILDYGEDYKKEDIYLVKYDFLGTLNTVHYIDRFIQDDFERGFIKIEKLHKILENNHLSILKYVCRDKSLFIYIDYFSKTDDLEKKLKPASLHYFMLQNNTEYTFNYENVDEINIALLEGKNQPTVVFENSQKQWKTSTSITLKRKDANINKFYLTTSEKADLPIRIITRYNVENLPRTKIDSLYKIDNTFIYDIPDFTTDVTFYLTRKSSLRALEESGVEVCYNAGSVLLLDKINVNCFTVEDEYEFKYTVPQDRAEGSKSYVVLYPSDPNMQINVNKVEANTKSDGQNSGNNGHNKEEEGGSGWIVVLIIILVVIILIAVGVFIFIKMRKPKRLNSEDIERDVKKESQMEIVD